MNHWGIQRFDGGTAFGGSHGGFFQGCSVWTGESSPCPSKHCLCQWEMALQPSPVPSWKTVTNFVLCQLQQNFYLHIIQGEGFGRGWSVEAAAGQHPSCCWGRRHNIRVFPRALFPAQCWQQGVTGDGQEGGVSISQADHEVSGAAASSSSGTAIFLFSQPSLAGFLKGLQSRAWDLKLGLMSLMSPCSSLAEKPVCLSSIFNSDSPCSGD